MDLRDTVEFKEFGYNIVTCPVCGHQTLDTYWICGECGWEYSGDESANGASVEEYRQAYLDKRKTNK